MLSQAASRPDTSTRPSPSCARAARPRPPSAEEGYEALKKYTRDFTEEARKGKLDPVIGRDEEIRRTVQVLSRRTKNNPVLIGEPGVGKTAIVEGLVDEILHCLVVALLLFELHLLRACQLMRPFRALASSETSRSV